MSEQKEVVQTQGREPVKRAGSEAARAVDYVRPRVDVHEDANGITLFADLPGVSSDRLTLQVDKDTLLIEGEAVIDFPEGMRALYAETRHPHYRRSFALSSELDADAIQANLKDGVLTLRLPKKPTHQPRKIQVQSA
jgi:HSP20 family molecular chaperone IbpA